MPVITTVRGIEIEVADLVYDELCHLQFERNQNYKTAEYLSNECEHLKFLIKQLRIKKQTAKSKPTYALRMAAWEAEQELYAAIGIKVTQLELQEKAA